MIFGLDSVAKYIAIIVFKTVYTFIERFSTISSAVSISK